MDTTLIICGVLAIVGLAIGTAALVVLQFSATGYSSVRDAVSDYAVGKYAWGYRTQVVAIGAAAAIEAAGFAHDGTAGAGAIVWLVVYAASRIAISFTPIDLPGAPRTMTGTAHIVLAFTAFTAIAVSTSRISGDLTGAPAWASWSDPLNAIAVLVVIAAIATAIATVLPPLRRSAFGLVERCLYATTIAWLLVAAVAFIAVGS